MIWVLALHAVCQLSGVRVFIDSGFHCVPGSTAARAYAVISIEAPLLPFGPIQIYRMRINYHLSPDGAGAEGCLIEDLGPIPYLFQSTSPAVAKISQHGMYAHYERQAFGARWQGDYHVLPGRRSVKVTYVSPWGELRYLTHRKSAPSGDLPVLKRSEVALAAAQAASQRISALADRLDVQARTHRGHGKLRLLVVFTDVYARALRALAEGVRSGVRKPPDLGAESPSQSAGWDLERAERAERPDSALGVPVDIRTFADPAWIADLAEAFADRFFRAVDTRDRGRAPEGGWEQVFAVLHARQLTEIDALALCIYAHIVFDLPNALAGLQHQEDAAKVGLRIKDYDLVNDALADHIDEIQDDLAARYSPLLGWLDILVGRYDEVFADRRLRQLRAQAWYYAERLRLGDEDTTTEVTCFLRDSVERYAFAVLEPDPPVVGLLANLTRSLFAGVRRW